MLEAVIFDFDGVIVDTELLHYQAFQEVLAPEGLGFSWEEYLEVYIGFDDRDAFRECFRRAERALEPAHMQGLIERKANVFRDVVEQKGIVPYPGVVRLADTLRAEVPLALCSGALRSDILPILDEVGLSGHFAVVVTAEDVTRSKPDPEAYAHALAELRRACDPPPEASGVLAVEDTPAGIEAARGANLAVLAVTNSYPADRLGRASKIVDTLEGLGMADLCACLPKTADAQ